MEILKRFAQLTISCLILLLFIGCKEEVIRTDVFVIEEPNSGNLTSVKVDGMGELFVNNDRIQTVNDESQIKGTLFSEIEGQFVPMTSGDFLLSQLDADGNYGEVVGYGIATIPEIGVFQSIITDFASGANFTLKRGSVIRSDDPLAPVQDDLNYFHIELNEDLGENFQFNVKNKSFTLKKLYMDPNDPMIYFRGDIGTSRFTVEDASIGLSARGNLLFRPYNYSKQLRRFMKVPLPSLNGNIFVGGRIPIPKYNIEVYGEALIGFTLNENGFPTFFENGFEGTEYRMGINGSVFLTNDFISYLPETEVGRATVVVELEEAGNNYIQIAGDAEIRANFLNEVLEKLDGGALTSFFSIPSQSVEAYFYIGDDLDNSQFFIRTSLTMTIPGIGPQELAQAMFGVDSEHIFIGADMGVPGLADVYVSGDVFYNGAFKLTGSHTRKLDAFVVAVSIGFSIEVTQDGFKISAFGKGIIAEFISFKVSVDVKINWETGSMSLCMKIPTVGNTCADFVNGVQTTLNGRPYTPRPEYILDEMLTPKYK